MAYSTTKVDIYRSTSGVTLPAQLSTEIWQKAVESSAVMRLARRVTLPGSGISIPVITGDPEAAWVGETEEKHVGESTFSTKTMTPYKLAIIELFSDEFKRDLPALYGALVDRLPGAIAKKFDATCFHASSAPGSNFDTLYNATEQSIADNAWAGLVAADTAIATAGGMLSGWAIAPQGRAILLAATDDNKRPLFVNSVADGAIPQILGEPAQIVKAAYDSTTNCVGIAGDWTKAVYGTVEGIKIKISEEATVNDGTNQINLWQRNMFAVMCEIEVGFVVENNGYFVRLTNETSNLS